MWERAKQWLQKPSAGQATDAAAGEGTGVKRVLFVCTGNICRSPTAEGVFRRMVEEAGLENEVHAASAGTIGYHAGEPPDQRAQAAARQRGYELERIRARRVTRQDFARFDLLLAMDNDHLEHLAELAPEESAHKVGLFLDYAPSARAREVPDPYYGGPQGFEIVLDLIEDASRGLLAAIRKEIEAGPERGGGGER
jgi:protein-tyrosine phosphatase